MDAYSNSTISFLFSVSKVGAWLDSETANIAVLLRLTYRLNLFSSKMSRQNTHLKIYAETFKRLEDSL